MWRGFEKYFCFGVAKVPFLKACLIDILYLVGTLAVWCSLLSRKKEWSRHDVDHLFIKPSYNISIFGHHHRENQSAEAAAINTVCKPRRPAGSFFVSEFAPISLSKPFQKEHCCLDSSILFGKVLWGWLAQFRNKVITQCRYGRRLGLIYEGSQSSTCCL